MNKTENLINSLEEFVRINIAAYKEEQNSERIVLKRGQNETLADFEKAIALKSDRCKKVKERLEKQRHEAKRRLASDVDEILKLINNQ